MRIIRFFDKLEDSVRGWLSHYPIIYGFVGGVGAVLFWRGVWVTADLVSGWFWAPSEISRGVGSINFFISPWDGPLCLMAGATMLLMTGLLVTNFIGNEIIISGLRGEKKLTEKTEVEVRTETGAIARILEEIRVMRKQMDNMESKITNSPKPKHPPAPPTRFTKLTR
ncbi:MAG: hypothetical protein V1489_02865 [Candidatus Liptonbacteria bacterium]